jgi:hypothetical protein
MATYDLISSNVLTTTAASVTFTGIPSTSYTDLLVRCSLRTSNANVNDYVQFQIGGITSNDYTDRYVYNRNGSAGSGSGGSTNGFYYAIAACGANATSNTFSSAEVYIPNAFGSTFKQVGSNWTVENNSSASYAITATAQLLSNTASITSMTFITSAGNFVSGSSFYLYGISNA